MKPFAILINLFVILIILCLLLSNSPAPFQTRALLLVLFVILPPMDLFVFFPGKKKKIIELILIHYDLTCGRNRDKNKR